MDRGDNAHQHGGDGSHGEQATAFVTEHTILASVPFVPEIKVRTGAEAIELWEETERRHGVGLAPPFWAFPWAGGQALARYVLDHPSVVADRRVLDLASGSGLVAFASVRAGATAVLANEIDPYAIAAIRLNAEANRARVRTHLGDLLTEDPAAIAVDPDRPGVDVVLAGDVFYSRAMATAMLDFMLRARDAGAEVLVGDPGRAYVPKDSLVRAASYEVPVNRDLEDVDVKNCVVWRLG